MREHDVGGEEPRVREGEDDPGGVTAEAHVGQEVDPERGGGNRGEVPPGQRGEQCERHGPHELDRRDGRERQPVDREVEARVHHGQRAAHREDRAPSRLPLARDEGHGAARTLRDTEHPRLVDAPLDEDDPLARKRRDGVAEQPLVSSHSETRYSISVVSAGPK